MTDQKEAVNPTLQYAKGVADAIFDTKANTVEEIKAKAVNILFQKFTLAEEREGRFTGHIKELQDEIQICFRKLEAAGIEIAPGATISETFDHLIDISQRKSGDVHNHVHHHWHQPGVVEYIGDVLRAELGDTVIENRISVEVDNRTAPQKLSDELNSQLTKSWAEQHKNSADF